MSDKINIYSSLSKFHEEVGKIIKDSTNPHFRSKYADIDTVLDAIRVPLKNAGLCFTQLPMQGGLKTIISTLDGESSIESFVEYVIDKNNMQGLGSAITYARRYALVSMLGLEAEDDDGNNASKPKQEASKQQVKEVLKTQEQLNKGKFVKLLGQVMTHFKCDQKHAQDLLSSCGIKTIESVESSLNDFSGLIALMENKIKGEA